MLVELLLALVIIILLVNTILSSITSYDVNDKEYTSGYKYSTWTAVSNGITLAIVVGALFAYHYREAIMAKF